jgi:hypothetical protein
MMGDRSALGAHFKHIGLDYNVPRLVETRNDKSRLRLVFRGVKAGGR